MNLKERVIEDICSFLEFLFIIFFVIPILLPFVMLQKYLQERKIDKLRKIWIKSCKKEYNEDYFKNRYLGKWNENWNIKREKEKSDVMYATWNNKEKKLETITRKDLEDIEFYN